MLIAGVVLVKDLYHMACVRIENVPSTSANNHVHPKAGKPMRQEPCCLMGAMASLGFSLNFTPSHVWRLVEHTRTIFALKPRQCSGLVFGLKFYNISDLSSGTAQELCTTKAALSGEVDK